jgi:hypothetical protein
MYVHYLHTNKTENLNKKSHFRAILVGEKLDLDDPKLKTIIEVMLIKRIKYVIILINWPISEYT